MTEPDYSVEAAQVKAARIRAGQAKFGRLRVSSEQLMREKRAELQQEMGDAAP
jgi:hypothetical protein